jgi:hypothetical protein
MFLFCSQTRRFKSRCAKNLKLEGISARFGVGGAREDGRDSRRWRRPLLPDSVEEVWFEVIAVPLIGGLGEAGEQRAA